MFITTPLFTIDPEYEDQYTIIENEDIVAADEVAIIFGPGIITNGTFTILGEMVIL